MESWSRLKFVEAGFSVAHSIVPKAAYVWDSKWQSVVNVTERRRPPSGTHMSARNISSPTHNSYQMCVNTIGWRWRNSAAGHKLIGLCKHLHSAPSSMIVTWWQGRKRDVLLVPTSWAQWEISPSISLLCRNQHKTKLVRKNYFEWQKLVVVWTILALTLKFETLSFRYRQKGSHWESHTSKVWLAQPEIILVESSHRMT